MGVGGCEERREPEELWAKHKLARVVTKIVDKPIRPKVALALTTRGNKCGGGGSLGALGTTRCVRCAGKVNRPVLHNLIHSLPINSHVPCHVMSCSYVPSIRHKICPMLFQCQNLLCARLGIFLKSEIKINKVGSRFVEENSCF